MKIPGNIALIGLLAVAGAQAYTYDYSEPNLQYRQQGVWYTNGYFNPSGSYVEFGVQGSGTAGASIIYGTAVSGANPNDYEVASTIEAYSGATFIHFMRASSNAYPGVGSYISAELVVPVLGGASAASTLNINQCVNGTVTRLGSAQVTGSNYMSFRTVIFGTNLWVYINNNLVMMQTLPSATTGYPGFGGSGQSDSDYFAQFQIGPRYTTPPANISSTGFASSVYPTTASMKWQPPSDGGGPGLLEYQVSRNGVWAYTTVANLPEYLDATVQASQTYNYTIQAVDLHGNFSSGTTFTITTPASKTGPGAPPNTADPRRVGLRTNGSYWGGGGEQIDTLSGNLNFSLPLLKAQGRPGWGVPVNLVYNSQNWRQDNGANWQLGYDVGFGFGWKLLIGSLTPYYNPGNNGVDHYVYTDNTGAEYQLTVNNSGVWSSLEGIYVWFDANAGKLHFRDGTFWVMGSVSGGSEADAGSMYPTIIEDVSGNQVIVTYDHGAGLASTATNTSARIIYIEDARAVSVGCQYSPRPCVVRWTYNFVYDGFVPGFSPHFVHQLDSHGGVRHIPVQPEHRT